MVRRLAILLFLAAAVATASCGGSDCNCGTGVAPGDGPATTLTFDSFPGCNYLAGSPVPPASRVSNQFQAQTGLVISSGGGYASVTNNPGAPSTPNALGGSTPGNLVTYARANPVTFTFFDPHNSSRKGAVKSFSLIGDTLGLASQNVMIKAYDVHGNLVATDTKADVGGETLSVSFSTPIIHQVVFLGSVGDNDGVAVDNVTFTPVAVP